MGLDRAWSCSSQLLRGVGLGLSAHRCRSFLPNRKCVESSTT